MSGKSKVKKSKFKKQRRVGIELPGLGKPGALAKRNYRPGHHGQARRRDTDYALRLTEKQKVLFHYNMREKQFKYSNRSSTSKFFDSATLTTGKITITSDTMIYENEEDTMQFPDGLLLDDEHSSTTMKSALLDINTSDIHASSNISTTYQKPSKENDSHQIKELLKKPTIITAENMHLNYENKNNPSVTYSNNVLTKQAKKSIESDTLTINFDTDTYIAKNNVKISFDNLKWALNPNRTIHNKDIKSMIQSPMTIQTNKAQFNPSTNEVTFSGSVILKQKIYKLTCDTLTFDTNKELITINGNINIKKFGLEHLKAEELIIDIKKEQFITNSPEQLSEIKLEI